MELLTVQETARMLKRTPATIRRHIMQGRLAGVKVNRDMRVPKESVEAFVTPVAARETPPTTHGRNAGRGRVFTMKDSLWNIVGIGETDEPTDVAHNKHAYVADAYAAETEETSVQPNRSRRERIPRGKPMTADDPLSKLIGMARSDGPTDVSENKHKYLAEAYMPKPLPEE